MLEVPSLSPPSLSPLTIFPASTTHIPLPHREFKIKKCPTQMPPAKYLVRRRHSLAPEAIIWEGKVLEDTECPPKLVGAQPRRSCQLSNSSASTGHAPSTGVAIDSKIEQAMDLVKTHLIYAVRDEIELLRSRIMELETTVIRLEAENTILRENIPNEVLATLCLDPIPPTNPPKHCGAFANAGATAIAQF